MALFFLTSGLFLGWSLGANDAANVFGTAVATRMVRFRTAAIICGVFVVLGAVISGGGASGTLGELGAVNALAGSFMAALSAALAVFWMTKAGLPVSTSQAIIGGIVGWNLFTGTLTDRASLARIVSAWVLCPVLAAAFAALLFLVARVVLAHVRVHMLRLDMLTRISLVVAGAFGAYALGANNIANVAGVFVPAVPLRSTNLLGVLHFSSAQQLFLVGSVAIAVGIFSYSHRVMSTVGRDVFKLTPITALIVVLAEGIVLFLFASESLETWLITHGLPPMPLVPVSSSQAVIGAVIGIAVVKGGRGINFGILRRVAGGWVVTPVIAAVTCFIGLFFLQNVFSLSVSRPVPFMVTEDVIERLRTDGIRDEGLLEIEGVEFRNAREFRSALVGRTGLSGESLMRVIERAEIDILAVDPGRFDKLDVGLMTEKQFTAVRALEGRVFGHRWELAEALREASGEWKFLPRTRENHLYNRDIENRLRYIYESFRVSDGEAVGGR